MPFDVGDSIPIAVDVKDSAGALVNASTAVLTVTLPDGTTETPAVTNPPSVTGQYRVTYIPATEGRYTWRFVTTTPSTAYQDAFEVRETATPALLSLADAKAHLNITSTTPDDELREFLEAATAVIEEQIGPVVRRTHTARIHGGRQQVPLPHTQVLEVTAVTYVRDGATAVNVADLAVNTDAGVISRKDAGCLPSGDLDVTYEVGRSYVKSNWTLAAKIIVQHLWRTQLGSLPAIQGDDPGYVQTGAGYLVPYRALALLHSDTAPLGFA
jgi:hypothetical protein